MSFKEIAHRHECTSTILKDIMFEAPPLPQLGPQLTRELEESSLTLMPQVGHVTSSASSRGSDAESPAIPLACV